MTAELDLKEEMKGLSTEARTKALQEISEFLVEQTNIYLSKAQSPVEGESFPGLSSNYKKYKQSENLPGVPNLEFTGNMRDSIDARPIGPHTVEFGVFGETSLQADGHNNFSGKSELPKRRFIPTEEQQLKSGIRSRIKDIIDDYRVEDVEITRSDIAEISTEIELWSFLKETFPELTRSEITDTILRNVAVAQLFDEFNLLRFLRGKG